MMRVSMFEVRELRSSATRRMSGISTAWWSRTLSVFPARRSRCRDVARPRRSTSIAGRRATSRVAVDEQADQVGGRLQDDPLQPLQRGLAFR
jgi:hypothetical protein